MRYPNVPKKSLWQRIKDWIWIRYYLYWVLRGAPSDPIHAWFSLSYASYLVLPRSVLQAAPHSWQRKFVKLVNELDDMVDYGDASYTVQKRDRKGRFITDPLCNYRYPRNDLIHWKNKK